MIDSEGNKAITVRDELHKLVEELPEEKLVDVRQFIDDLKTGTEAEETVSAESLAAIQEGLEGHQGGAHRTTRGS